MDAQKLEQLVAQALLFCRIIHLSLVVSVAGFLLFAIVAPAGNIEPTLPRLDWIFAGFGIATAFGGWILPSLIMARSPASAPATAPRGDSEARDARLAIATLQSAMIVGWAMFEGGAIGNLLWYYSDKQPLNFVIGVVLVIFLLFRFPTRGAMLDKVEARLRRQRDERLLGA